MNTNIRTMTKHLFQVKGPPPWHNQCIWSAEILSLFEIASINIRFLTDLFQLYLNVRINQLNHLLTNRGGHIEILLLTGTNVKSHVNLISANSLKSDHSSKYSIAKIRKWLKLICLSCQVM